MEKMSFKTMTSAQINRLHKLLSEALDVMKESRPEDVSEIEMACTYEDYSNLLLLTLRVWNEIYRRERQELKRK